jgi:hypothetical protein
MLKRFIMSLAALLLLAGAAQATEWPVNKAGDNVCVASGPETATGSLSIVTFGPQIMLLVGSADFPKATDSYKIGLSFDGNPVVTVDAEARNGQYGIPITPPLAAALRRAAHMVAIYAGKTYEFALDGAGPAIDGVLHCVGQPPYDQMTAHHDVPVAGADRWVLEDKLPGADRCSVRANGADIDTMLMLNRSGKLILVAGHADWARPLTSIEADLQIDQDPVLKLQANTFTNLVLAPLSDEQTARLRSAHTLSWHLPWGDYRSEVSGLGLALDALAACQARKHPAP